MKKVLLSAVAILGFAFANAQEEAATNGGFAKGDVFVTGSVGFGSEKYGDFDSNSFNVSPSVGYFVSENIAVGVQLNFNTAENGMVYIPEAGEAVAMDKFTNFGAEVFGRYYFTPADQFSLFGQLAVGFGSEKYENGGGDIKATAFGVNAGLGLNYFVANNWALQASWAGLGYNSHKFEDADDAYNTFGLNVDLSAINLGVVYKF